MERMTFDGNFCEIAQCRELPCPHGSSCTQKQVWERLKQYEDTGLMPNDVTDMMAANGNAIATIAEQRKALRDLPSAGLPVCGKLCQPVQPSARGTDEKRCGAEGV